MFVKYQVLFAEKRTETKDRYPAQRFDEITICVSKRYRRSSCRLKMIGCVWAPNFEGIVLWLLSQNYSSNFDLSTPIKNFEPTDQGKSTGKLV